MKTDVAAEMDFTYYSAVHTVKNTLSKVKDERGMRRVGRFLHEARCPACHGSRLSEPARSTTVRGLGLDEACRREGTHIGVSDLAISQTFYQRRSYCRPVGQICRRHII